MLSFSLPELDKKKSWVFKKENIQPVVLKYFYKGESQRSQCNSQLFRRILWNQKVLLFREGHKFLKFS